MGANRQGGKFTLSTVHTQHYPLYANSAFTDLHNHPWWTFEANWSGSNQSTPGGGGSSVMRELGRIDIKHTMDKAAGAAVNEYQRYLYAHQQSRPQTFWRPADHR